jgi:hypothetical protein
MITCSDEEWEFADKKSSGNLKCILKPNQNSVLSANCVRF